jgi:parallel beta-helix repeat protein
MNIKRSNPTVLNVLSMCFLVTSTAISLGACGGDNEMPRESASLLTQTQAEDATNFKTMTIGETHASAAPPSTGQGFVLPIPSGIPDGATVSLQCGTTYQGTLELNGRSNVTVTTVGGCGKAIITPGQPITGWVRSRGNIYSAPVDFIPVQVLVDGTPAPAAHWPDVPQVWASMATALPSSDLRGATLVYLDNRSVIKSEQLAADKVSTDKPFYLEGKLWMLDHPGEWAMSDGRLYLWTRDGRSPERRVTAASGSNGINADNSTNVTIDGVSITSAFDGISANKAVNLKVTNTDIANSGRDGIWASGSRGLTVDGTAVTNARRNGIDGWYSMTGGTVINSTVSNTGMVNMPTPSDGSIFFGDGIDNRIANVRVINSSHHGIVVLHNRNTSVTNSIVNTACVVLTDCGGIYTNARDKLPLSLRIEGNTVANVKGPEGIGIYLDDSSNGVTVLRNKLSNNTKAMMIHSGFDNLVAYNEFTSSGVVHIAFPQDANTTIRDNTVVKNIFRSTNGEQTYNLGPGANVKTFAKFDYNTYSTTNPNVFARTWDGISPAPLHSFSSWKIWSGQDIHSTLNGLP